MKDKRNRHGAVGKSSSEQHFCKSAAINFISGALQRLAEWISKFSKLAVGQNIRLVASFNQGTESLQPYQCIPAGFFG